MYYFSYAYLPLFLGLTVLAYFLVPLKRRWYVLLAASLLFYAYYAKFLCVCMLTTALTIYCAGLWIDAIQSCDKLAREHLPPEKRAAYKSGVLWQKKAVVFLLVVINFGILAVLKYAGVAARSANELLSALTVHASIPAMHILLPLGISFYTLQAVSYVVDVYRGKIRANRNFGQVLLFVCFFPQIVEGPIGRYDHLAPQLFEGHRFDFQGFTHGVQLIVWGLFKEFVIADRAGLLVNRVFGHPWQYSGLSIVLAILLYTLQLYADFSGCMDVAMGSAQMMGIRLTPNFQRPFFSRSVGEFWRRWHITLGAWLRDYVFYPVSLSKPLTRFQKFIRREHNTHFGKCVAAGSALIFVWLGMGIWHGAGWKYIVYGLYYYLLMMLGMLLEPLLRQICSTLHINRDSLPFRVFQILRTFLLVNIGMLLFRADTLVSAFRMFVSQFRFSGISVSPNGSLPKLSLDVRDLIVLAVSAAVLLAVGLLQEKGIRLRGAIGRWPLPARWAAYVAAVLVVVVFGAYGAGYAPANLIYAGF